MDQEELFNKIEEIIEVTKENSELIKENLDLSKKNSKKIKKIQSFARRTFISKLIYWLILIFVAAGAFYAVKPHVENAIETYNSFQDKVNKTSEMIENPSSFFGDFKLLNTLLGR